MARAIDITVVITAHNEGVIAGATANSALKSIAHATAILSLNCEVVVVFDTASHLTVSTLTSALNPVNPNCIEVSVGDPGQARNVGISTAKGDYIALLDADDLWSVNWLVEAWKFVKNRSQCIAHSACNLIFGNERNLWWHTDSEDPLFDADYLDIGNYWDAMCFASSDIFRKFPYRKNDLRLGFGHEDWHWNVVTLHAGIPHKPVPNTMHFKRRRHGSQMELVEKAGNVRWPA